MDAMRHTKINQSCLLQPGDDPHIELGLCLEALHKGVLIIGFACCRRGHCDDIVCPLGTCQFGKLFGNQHGPLHGCWLQVLTDKLTFAKAYDLSEFGQNGVRMVRMQAHQQQAD